MRYYIGKECFIIFAWVTSLIGDCIDIIIRIHNEFKKYSPLIHIRRVICNGKYRAKNKVLFIDIHFKSTQRALKRPENTQGTGGISARKKNTKRPADGLKQIESNGLEGVLFFRDRDFVFTRCIFRAHFNLFFFQYMIINKAFKRAKKQNIRRIWPPETIDQSHVF